MTFSSRRLDRYGRVTGVREGILGSDEDRAAAIVAEMHSSATNHHGLAVDAVIEPFRLQMTLEHRPTIVEIAALLRDRPLIPQSNVEFFARGIFAGYNGDFLEATHLLVPALEHALRMLLYASGKLPYSHSAEGIQDFFDLKKILDEPALTTILGENYVFELKGLLVSRSGANLRNDLAHGLLTPGDTRGPVAKYFWWLTLKLIVELNYTGSNKHDTAAGQEPPHEPDAEKVDP